MCGICGIISLEGKKVDQIDLERMRDCMIHRGPDDKGIYLEGTVGLGHRRLSIIDLEGGKQPIFNETGDLAIVFNGEIYNFQSLREGLLKRGHTFKTHSDTEVILHLYEEEGPDCLAHFRGMFAFAIADKLKKELFIARDRLGIKPVYYYENGKKFLFASEIKAILESGEASAELNEVGFTRYLKYRFVYGKQTLFKGIYELLPGHYMVIGNNGITTRQYWNVPSSGGKNIGFNEAKDHLLEKLEESVRLRMISDVPIGMFLSGGIDSSAITGLMARNSPDVKTYSIGFIPEELNELEYARVVSDHFKTEHFEYFLESEDFYSLLRKLIWHHDEPLMFPASIPLYILSRESKQSATVMLAGEGADEIFAGYMSNVKAYWFNYLRKAAPPFIANRLRHLPIGSRYQSLLGKAMLDEKDQIRSFFMNSWGESFDKISDRVNLRDENEEDLWEEIGVARIGGSFLDKFLYFQLKTYLVALLMKQDKMSMAASIETRVPFLDHQFVEMVWQFPDHFKVNMNQGKYVFKKACEKQLPKEIVYRKKMGFPVPIEKWFGEEGNPFIQLLSDEETRKNGYFKGSFVEREIEQFNNGSSNAAIRLWTILNVEIWRREFIK